MREQPYPSDTKAKGWRLELDMEQFRQSDTWALASPTSRPWLLMLWAVAWEQVPCGSLPNDDELIAARLGIDVPAFSEMKRVLLRNWWIAEDGRFYHDVMVSRVNAMLEKKAKDRDRKSGWRTRQSNGVTPESRVTDVGRTVDSTVSDDTKHQAPSTSNTSSLRSDVKKPRASRKPEPSGSLSVQDLVAEGVSERHAIDWMRVRKDKGAKSLTQTAWLLVKTEAAKAGLSPAQAVEMSAANSWQGFKAEWVKPQSTTGPGRHLERPLTPSERAAYASTPSICSERVRRLMEQEQKNGQQTVIEMEVGHVAAISMG